MTAKIKKYWLVIIAAIMVALAVILILIVNNRSSAAVSFNNLNTGDSAAIISTSSSATGNLTTNSFGLAEPISQAVSRVTKKTFGLYVSPGHSPISPEGFTGYHTGVDFETTAAEQNIDVPIYAICSGPLIIKKTASGYGGVAVQSCHLNQSAVTVIYGHLRLTSVTSTVGTILKPGQQLGVLGTGYSKETDGERKHLHLGIHKGTAVNILGYVQIKSQLSQWLDFLTLFK